MLEEQRTQAPEEIREDQKTEGEASTTKPEVKPTTRRRRAETADPQAEVRVVIWPDKPAEIIDEGGPHAPRLAEVQKAMKADPRIRVMLGKFEEPVIVFRSQLEAR